MASTESIRDLAEPVLASAGLELWDVEMSRDVVRIMVDRPGGIDLDGLSAASALLSPLFDRHPEVVPENRYQLEVSSPGVERTLRKPEQYLRYVGSEVTVKTSQPVGGARRHRGRLLHAGETGIAIEPDEAAGTRLELPYEQIDRARTVLVWGPAPGRARGRQGSDRSAPGRARGRQGSGRSAPGPAAAALPPKDAAL